MIYILIAITLVFLVLNFLLVGRDYMHPAVVFHGMFLIYELVCLLGKEAYAVKLHIGSMVVLSLGFFTMTLANLISYDRRKNKQLFTEELKEIKVPRLYIIALLIMQIVSVIYFYKYLGDLASAYGLKDPSLSESIKLYDTMTKFWRDEYKALSVPIPMAYRITNPICAGAEYIVLYIMVNNYLVNKKLDIPGIVSFGLMCLRIVMNGSRSPLLRIFTYVFLLFYILNLRNGTIKKGDRRFFGKLVIAGAGFIVAMFLSLIVMGRTEKFTGIANNLFIYLGAPLVNLDNFIEGYNVKLLGALSKGTLFGAQSFKGLYQYIDKLFKVEAFSDIKDIELFVFSSNGREIGNVYTMFYKIIYDFGFLGVLPLTFIMGTYCCETYRKINCEPKTELIIDLRLLLYAYLFNDIVMSAFSNRFYETIFDAVFIKFFIVVWGLDFFLLEKLDKCKFR